MAFSGVMDRIKDKFGFIKQDSGEDDMFVLPVQCQAFGGDFPPIGSRVIYDVTTDLKTGRPRADNVQPSVETRYGTFDRHKDKFGFIKQDSGLEDMFVMPGQCVGFGGAFPPIGCRVTYSITLDEKTGLPRAEDVHPDNGFSNWSPEVERSWAMPSVPISEYAPEEPMYCGTMDRKKGAFGFIKQDTGEDDMFVMPAQCLGFGCILPPLGTRVIYSIADDPKTGRPRAENVSPHVERTYVAPAPRHVPQLRAHPNRAGHALTGVLDRVKGNFGFIKQDSGEEDMFVMPQQCSAFGGAFPSLGSRIAYSVVLDAKTGRPRAEDVRPEVTHGSGVMDRIKGNFGFIRQDSGEDDMFVMPAQCAAFGGTFPPLGTRVIYAIVLDAKTGLPRADAVLPESSRNSRSNGGVRSDPLHKPTLREQASAQKMHRPTMLSGTMSRDKGAFGFIQLENGDEMFVIPASCAAFGGKLPALGERVSFAVVVDAKTGRPRAEDVQPDVTQPSKRRRVDAGAHSGIRNADEEHSGTFDREKGKFGFIKQDSGEDDMFVMPAQCEAFDGAFPAIGTRVRYEIVLDAKTGKPRAENVKPLSATAWNRQDDGPAFAQDEATNVYCGTMDRDKGAFGFIKQDSGESMFVMPAQCLEFGGALPPIGTRVAFSITIDAKTGRPRAEDVIPEEVWTAAQEFSDRWDVSNNGVAKGDSRSKPY